MTVKKTKFGYLPYEKMLDTIAKGGLDAYDINFTPDRKECYVVDPNLKPWAIRSKVLVFDDESNAVTELNKDAGTYPGQIVAVMKDEKYNAYIVNRNSDSYIITPLSSYSDKDVDYNTLGNRPIINLSGSLAEPIIADELDDGFYSFSGQYKISTKLETVFSGSKAQLFCVEKNEDIVYVRKISGKEIILYTVGDSVTESSIITSEFLKENGYAKKQDIDNAISALQIFSKNDAEEYIIQLIQSNEPINDKLNTLVEQKVKDQVTETTDEEIDSLFI